MRLHSLIDTALLARCQKQLVLGEIQIAVPAHAHRIRPVDPWIPHKGLCRPVGRVVRHNRVRLYAARVDNVIIGVAFKTIRDPLSGSGPAPRRRRGARM